VIMGGIVYAVSFLPINYYLMLAIQIVVGVTSYILISMVSHNENYEYIIGMIKKRKSVV